MNKFRIRFSKTGIAKYISHLDLMRTMQRVFVRNGLEIKHTQGFNPHPHMVFALPLSVGCESVCELMDFELTKDTSIEEVKEALSSGFPLGITVEDVYVSDQKFKDIVWLSVEGKYEYDCGIEDKTFAELRDFYKQESIVITKKTKRGMGQSDIIPNIYSIELTMMDENTVNVKAVIAAQNPSLNPEHLINALKQLRSELVPDFSLFKRLDFLDKDLHIFK